MQLVLSFRSPPQHKQVLVEDICCCLSIYHDLFVDASQVLYLSERFQP